MKAEQQLARYLGQNIEKLRRKKNWSQQQLAKHAELPRSTLTNIESGGGNPSLLNLAKISGALGVGIEELLSKPRAETQLISAENVPTQTRNQVKIFKLLPDRIKGLDMDRMEFAPAAVLAGHPHLSGTKEYLSVLQGEIAVYVAGQTYTVKKGDVFAFQGDQPHSYRNASKSPSIAISVVIPVPATA